MEDARGSQNVATRFRALQRGHKVAERALVDRFRRCWSGGPSILSLHRYESPDLYGLTSGGRVGIEVVRLVDEEVASSGPMVKKHLARKLETAANAAGVAVLFDVDFYRESALRLRSRRDRAMVVSQLVELARDPTTHGRFLGRDELAQRNVAGVDHVRLVPSKREWGSGVLAGRRGWGLASERERDKNVLRKCLAKKDADEPLYRSRIAEGAGLWLLVAAGLSFDSFVDIEPTDGPFETRFDRLFVLDSSPDRAFELRIRRSAVASR